MVTNRIRKYFEQPKRATRTQKAIQPPEGFATIPVQLLPVPHESLQQYAQLYRSAYERAVRQVRASG